MEPTYIPPVFGGHHDTLLNLHLPERGKGRCSFFERGGAGKDTSTDYNASEGDTRDGS